MPEFGVLDGVEWSGRRHGGDRYGASFGWMPEPDEDFDSFSDVQIAAFYEWVADTTEQLAAAVGYQKTWHEGNSDRDLIVVRFHHLPKGGWQVHGTVWVDLYTGGEAIKSGAEITQAVVSAFRRWTAGHGVGVTYTRQRFPEILRSEFTPVAATELADNHYDRVSIDGWLQDGRKRRWRGHVSGFTDEQGNGGAAEAGLELHDLFLPHGRGELTLFGTLARFENTVGARVTFGRYARAGYWEALYEVANHHKLGFPSDRDDLLQHRVRGGAGLILEDGWDFSAHAELVFFDGEASWSIGLYVQKRF
jgi:hypothetical protein